MLGSVTYYPLCSVSPWTGIHNLPRWKLSTFQDYHYHPWVKNLLLCVQLTYLSSQRAYAKFHLRNYYGHSFHEYASLGSLNGTLHLNPKRYHGAFIENTYCYWLPSTVTPIHGEYMINLRSHPLVKVIANFSTSSIFSQGWETTQWSSLVRSWLLDSLKSWLTIGDNPTLGSLACKGINKIYT